MKKLLSLIITICFVIHAFGQTDSSLSNYLYSLPAGWRTTQYPDGIVLSSVTNTGEQCSITLWPMRQAGNNLQNDANNLFNEIFKAFEIRSSSTPPSLIKGTSAQGWEYFIVKKSIGIPGGDYQTLFAFSFVAKLGNQLAAITGMSKDPLVSGCFGLIQRDVWPKFFYSLQFKNWKATTASVLVKKIPGVWMAVTGSAGDRFAFAGNGRFAGAAASQRYVHTSSTELLRITNAYFGDGAYRINGNGITLIYDGNKKNPEPALLRIEQESKDQGKHWTDRLYLLRKNKTDGQEYEVGYDKQKL